MGPVATKSPIFIRARRRLRRLVVQGRCISPLILGLGGAACASNAQAADSKMRRLQDEVVRLQTKNDRLEERLASLEYRQGAKPEERSEEDVEAAEPELEVVHLSPSNVSAEGEIASAVPAESGEVEPRIFVQAAKTDDPKRSARTEALPRSPAVVRYEEALALVRDKRYQEAIAAFAAFLADYPQHPHADNAVYWQGECHYATGRLEAARDQFARVIRDYPHGNKVPDALLKLGLTERKLGHMQEARRAFTTLSSNFPNSDANRRLSEGL